MAAGVAIIDPSATWIETDVAIGADTILHPGRLPPGTNEHRRNAASSSPAFASSMACWGMTSS